MGEPAASEALADMAEIPAEQEREVRHDVIAFTTALPKRGSSKGLPNLTHIMRYTGPEMSEFAASEALAEMGEIPADAAQPLRQNASFDLNRIQE